MNTHRETRLAVDTTSFSVRKLYNVPLSVYFYQLHKIRLNHSSTTLHCITFDRITIDKPCGKFNDERINIQN